LIRKLNYKAVCERFFLGFSAVHSLVEDKDLVSFVSSVFLVGFDDEIWHGAVGLKHST
jgi:hypothetical protein